MPYDKNNPFLATVTARKKLTEGSALKNTQHLELSLEGSGYSYLSGDSVGVYASNDPTAVDALMAAYGLDPRFPVIPPGKKEAALAPLREVLLKECSLIAPTREGLMTLAEVTSSAQEREALEELLQAENVPAFLEYTRQRDWLDVAQEYPHAKLSAATLVRCMRKMMPRLYSIASSPIVYPGSVHLTVAVVAVEMRGRLRKGVATTYLAERVPLSVPCVPIFIGKSTFHLPADPSVDIIMIGPGTGVAPYRAFLQEREATGATGRNWLFFGEQHRATDFLYGEELERFKEKGILTHLSLAFSRDQEHKIYVQRRMKEMASELWSWLKGGAYLYLCGDADHMAVSVEAALVELFEEQGNMDNAAATQYLKDLRKNKRYFKDVY